MSAERWINWRLFGVLLAAAAMGNLAALPYIFTLMGPHVDRLPVPIPVAALVQFLQGTVFFAVFILLGLMAGRAVGVGSPILSDCMTGKPIRRTLGWDATVAALVGALAGALIFLLDRYAFVLWVEPITPFQAAPPLWQRALVCFYGGINEEIAMRLFLTSAVVWMLSKLQRFAPFLSRAAQFWTAIIFTNIIFGISHLPMTAMYMDVTVAVVIRAIVLNSAAGVPFGWLFWKNGLETAVIAHFVTDVVLHVMLPELLGRP